MGFFGGSETYVSSVLYNLAGDVNKRPNYLKTTVLGSVLTPQSTSLGEDITNAYLNGPGIRFRTYANWAQDNYIDVVGQTSSSVVTTYQIDADALKAIMEVMLGTIQLQSYTIGLANYTDWAEQYMLANYPAEAMAGWTADVDPTTKTIKITRSDGSVVSFVAADYDPNSQYIAALYNTSRGATTGDVVPGTVQTVTDFDSVSGWTVVSTGSTPQTATLTTTVEKIMNHPDGTTTRTTTTTTSEEAYTEFFNEYSEITYQGILPSGSVGSEKEIMVQQQVGAVITNPTVTTGGAEDDPDFPGQQMYATYNTTTQSVQLTKYQRIDTQEITLSSWGPATLYIYKQGSGNADLDALFATAKAGGIFMPYIPFRVNNQEVSNTTAYADVYTASKKAFKKAMNSEYDKVDDTILSNKSLGDIDYAYAVFAVSLNTPENASLQYVYKFFQNMILQQSIQTDDAWEAWKATVIAAGEANVAWQNWYNNQRYDDAAGYGAPEPQKLTVPPLPSSNVTIASNNKTVMNFHMEISWTLVTEETGTGLVKEGALMGDLWWTQEPDETYPVVYVYAADEYSTQASLYQYAQSVQTVKLWWQDSATSWRCLTMLGLSHRNLVYGGKSIDINAKDALNDTEESGFLVPVQMDIYKALPLTVSTQMATSCAYMVFNCYQVVKKKWWQTGIFQIIVLVIIIVITIYTAGAGSGLLGANAAVGASLGFTGTAAIIAGAAVNAIAAMIVTQLIMMASTKLLGDKVGSIVGSIVSMVAIAYGGSLMNGSNTSMLTELTKADNLIRLTEAGIQDYTKIIQTKISDLVGETAQAKTSYEQQSEKISDLWAENIGTDTVDFDPMRLTSSTINGGASDYTPETLSTFLSRTLMTGTDLAQASFTFLLDYPTLSTSLDLPLNFS